MKPFDKNEIPSNAKILLIKLRSIGDVIYNTSVYSSLKRCFPDSHFSVLVEMPSYDLVRDHPAVDEVLSFEKGSLLKQFKFYWKLYKNRYDVAIDMHEGPRGALMCFLTLARFRIGNKYAKRSFLYNVKLDFMDLNPKYPIDYQTALISKMGVEFDKVAPEIFISETSKNKAQAILEDNGIEDGDKFCIIHPGTRKPYDQWEFSRFARLVEIFHRRYGFKVILTCGPGENHQVESIRKQVDPNVPTCFVQTGLQELASITSKACFVVCHDGGFVHLAAAMDTPIIGLYGWTNPKVWKPIGSKNVVIYKDFECSPCNRWTLKEVCLKGNPECKQAISVEDVLEAVDQVLSDKISRSSQEIPETSKSID